jgi:capsular exopolysaccharide synthesis family protein
LAEFTDPKALPPAGSRLPTPAGAPGPLAAPEPTRLVAVPVQEEAHFWDYWRVVVRHRWSVVTFFLVAVTAGLVWTYTTPPVYRGTATLKIEKEEPRVLKFDEVVKSDPQPDYYQTQYKILESRALADRVVGLLQLDRHPEFQEDRAEDGGWLGTTHAWARAQLVSFVPIPPPTISEEAGDLDVESPVMRAFAGRLSVEPVRNARLVRVSFESRSPELAARVPNTLAEAFITSQLDTKVEATRYATQFLARQMEEARSKLESAEDSLSRFMKANDMLMVWSEKFQDRQDLITQQLTSLSEALLRARAERINKEAQVEQAMREGLEAIPAVVQNPLIQKLKTDVTTMEGEYRKLAQTFKPEYPRMQRLAEAIAETKRQLRAEIKNVIESIDTDYRAAVQNERGVERALLEQRALAQKVSDQMAQHNLLRRDVDTSRELYTALMTRLKETQISAALLTSNVSIVDRAQVPMAPAKPRKALNLLVATAIGLVGGIGLAFLFDYLDTSIRNAREVESLLQVPTLGLVPAQRSLESRRARRLRERSESGEMTPFALVAHRDLSSVLAESFRNLRTSLLYSSPDQPPRTLMVTSLQSEDGKTSLASNLAIALAQLGAGEVLVVDGDMRRPNLHQLFDVEQAPGLSTFLTGQVELTQIVVPTPIPNLHVIPAGRVPLNPAELMASRRLGLALEVLRERFAHIVFDAPPLFGVSDAATLAPRLDGTILVLRHGRASRDGAQRAVQLLASVRARLLGVVLNDVDAKGESYYGHYGYYGYGYGGEPRRQDST